MSASNIDAVSKVKQVVIKSKREGTLYIEAQFRYSKQTHYKRVAIGPYDNDRAFVDEESKRFILHCDAGGTPATFVKRSSKDDPVPNVDPLSVKVIVKSMNKKRAREQSSIERQPANKNEKSPRSNNIATSAASKTQNGEEENSDSKMTMMIESGFAAILVTNGALCLVLLMRKHYRICGCVA